MRQVLSTLSIASPGTPPPRFRSFPKDETESATTKNPQSPPIRILSSPNVLRRCQPNGAPHRHTSSPHSPSRKSSTKYVRSALPLRVFGSGRLNRLEAEARAEKQDRRARAEKDKHRIKGHEILGYVIGLVQSEGTGKNGGFWWFYHS